MATPVVIPREGLSMENGIILKWHAEAGEKVAFGQPLCEVESEKVNFEIESPVDGTLLKIFYSEGETVPVLTPIAVIGKPGETIEGFQRHDTLIQSFHQDDGKRRISPRARKLAKDKGISIEDVNVDPIREKDVLEYLDAHAALTPAARDLIERNGLQPPVNGTGIGGRITVDDMIYRDAAGRPAGISGMRKTIADKMRHSLQNSAQYTLNSFADAAAMVALRRRFKESPRLETVTFNDMILFAVAKALAAFPQMNAHFSDGVMNMIDTVNLGFAVDLSDGLLVPVIPGADKLSLKQISERSRSLTQACRERRVKPHDLKGGTFTVSNLGALGISTFTPILNYPEVGILGVGEIEPRPVRRNGTVEFIDHLGLSLTVNHQAIDGAVGARFLKLAADNIRNIDMLLAV